MRIAQVAPLYERVPPKLYGGTERVVSYLTEELVRQGHEVTLFASGDSITRAKLRPGARRGLRLGGAFDPLAEHMVMLEDVFRHADDFDVIHFHCGYLHFPFARRHGVAHVTTMHGRLDLPELVPLHKEYAEMPLISISRSQRQPLPWAQWEATVYHGLPAGDFRFVAEPGDYLAFIGRISPEKQPDHAIQIARQAGMKIKIAAKVDPSDDEYFRKVIKPLLSQPGVEFVGEINEDQKNEFLGNARALLFPINWREPFGLVMIEALACGTPVIAYPCGSVSEVIDDGVSGFLVNDPAEGVNAVKRLPDIDRRMCRQVFEERFSARRMARDYLTVYQDLVGQQPFRQLQPRIAHS